MQRHRGWLPQLEAVAVAVDRPGEVPELAVFPPWQQLDAGSLQLRQKRLQVVYAVVDHEELSGAEVLGVVWER